MAKAPDRKPASLRARETHGRTATAAFHLPVRESQPRTDFLDDSSHSPILVGPTGLKLLRNEVIVTTQADTHTCELQHSMIHALFLAEEGSRELSLLSALLWVAKHHLPFSTLEQS